MPADEVSTGSDVDAARVRTTGPRHAAPKKPLFTRFHMPAGKAIALAAMPTAVLMGMGFTPTLANAEDQPTSKSLTIDEYKDCLAALEDADASASASPSPSASESAAESAEPSADESSDTSKDDSKDTSSNAGDTDGSSSSDSGSDDTAEPSPSASSSPSTSTNSGDTTTTEPSDTETSKNVLETIGDAITDLFDGSGSDATASSSPSPSASASASASAGDSTSDSGSSDDSDSSDSSGTSKDTTDAVTDEVKDTVETTEETAKDTEEDTEAAADDATASPSPSESAATDVDDCPVATEDESGIDNKIRLPDDPWFLNASSLLLKGADYQGIVKVKTANGTVKEVLKYVISDGTDIGDLHQTVADKQSGKTYHVQAGKGTTSTIRDGDTIMYTESISGNLFGLIPVTFTPKSPPPLNIPLIYFTNVKVQQAGQLGGTLTIPGLHQYTTAG
ncbi:hypothetical protein [Streptomyces sp. NPDC000618]|uniref:hypothetical protein n=1 Tax=Streptomyces sp. NPDC000618 TaxID=3154265 RepID=UPI00331E197C